MSCETSVVLVELARKRTSFHVSCSLQDCCYTTRSLLFDNAIVIRQCSRTSFHVSCLLDNPAYYRTVIRQ